MNKLCEHKAFYTKANIIRLDDGKFSAEIRITCTECNIPFQFIGMPMGFSFNKPMVEFGGLEARMPIQPCTDMKLIMVDEEVQKRFPSPTKELGSSK